MPPLPARRSAASSGASAGQRIASRIAERVAVVAGVPVANVLIDSPARRVVVHAAPLPGADLRTYRAIELRLADSEPGWSIRLVPLLLPLPDVKMTDGKPDAESVQTAIWASQRLGLPIGIAGRGSDAKAVGNLLNGAGVTTSNVSSSSDGLALQWVLPKAEAEAK